VTEATFTRNRKEAWDELDALLVLASRRGVRRLSPDEVEALGRLYRAATSDLSYASGRGYDARLLAYLNRLVARAHALVYGGSAPTGTQRIAHFYLESFPREVRRSFGFIAVCSAITVAGALVSYVLVRTNASYSYALLPHQLIPAAIRKSLHDSNFAFNPTRSPLVASEIITNNVKVAIIAFSGCVTLGVLTLWIILQNALMLGALCALFTNAGFGRDFWATIAPHGVIEVSAIQIAGACGLLISAGIIAPGRLRRRDSIRLAAQRAGVLIAGVASMLLVAGTIEGFISPLRLPADARIAIGAVTGVLLLLYLGFAGEPAAPEIREPPEI
jgi:uncharacterized membrane protein SpoIIM required for sporulation